MTEPLFSDDDEEFDRPRLAAHGPGHGSACPRRSTCICGVGPAARRRLSTSWPRSTTRSALYDEVTARRGDTLDAHHGRRGRRRAGARRAPTWSSGPRGRWPRRPAATRTPGCTCASRSRSPAGLAGGSADAAAALVACDALWGTGLSPRRPGRHRRRRLGSDVPFLVLGGTALGTGRGELVSPVLARGHAWHWVLAVAEGACRPRRSTASWTGCARRAAPPRPAARTGCSPRCASATPTCSPPTSPTTCRRRRCTLRPELRGILRRRARRRRARRAGLRLRPDLRLPGRGRQARRRCWPPTWRPASCCRAVAHRRRSRCPERECCRWPTSSTWTRSARPTRRGAALRRGVRSASDDSDRIGVVGLNGAGKTTLLRMLTKAEEPDAGRVTHRRDLRVAGPAADPGPAADRDRPRRRHRHRLAARRVRRRARVGRRRRGPDRAQRARHAAPRAWTRRSGRCPAASGAGWRSPRCWCAPADLLILDEPTNHLDVAGIAWLAAAPAAAPRRAHGRHPRPLVPRRGLHDHVGGRRRDRARLRGRLRRLDPRPGGAAAGRRGGRGPPAEPAPQGDRLAAPRPAGPDQQAEVPHRRGQRAHRRRAAGPGHGVAAAPGRHAAGQAGVRAVQGGPARPATGPCCPMWTGWSGPATGSRSWAPTGPARRRCCGSSPGSATPDGGRIAARQHRAGRVPVAGAGRAAGPGCACWRRSRRSPGGSSSATGS